ncbi:phage tail length tape measure family protein [Caenispirillum bisanense]|uniref:phage tail length tape measure family protein n=1 Tax=Caenispirillum bisanense TaxID=414052 RepID=UPI0031D16E4D
MATELNRIVHEIVIDDRQAAAGAERVSAALDKTVNSVDRLENAVGKAAEPWDRLTRATGAGARGLESAARGWDRINRSVDPAYRSLQQFEAAQEAVNRAVAHGVATQQEANRVLAMARQQYMGLGAAVNDNAGAIVRNETMVGRLTSRMGNMGGVMQQAGYQISDLVTQISMGGNAMQALAIQGGQFISMMGPWGAAIGTVVTVGGLLASTLMNAGDAADGSADATKKAKDALEAYESAIATSNEAMFTSTQLSRQLAQEKAKEAAETLKAALATETDALAKKMQALELQRQMAAEARERNQFLPEGQQQNLMRDPTRQTMQDILDAEMRIADLQKRIDALMNPAKGTALFDDLFKPDEISDMAEAMVEFPSDVTDDPEVQAIFKEAME